MSLAAGQQRMMVTFSGWGSALISLQCSDTIGRVTGRASGLEKPVPFVPKGYVPEQVREEHRVGTDRVTQIHVEKQWKSCCCLEWCGSMLLVGRQTRSSWHVAGINCSLNPARVHSDLGDWA